MASEAGREHSRNILAQSGTADLEHARGLHIQYTRDCTCLVRTSRGFGTQTVACACAYADPRGGVWRRDAVVDVGAMGLIRDAEDPEPEP